MSSNDTKKLELLDCTLRDGAYIVDAHFGVAAIKGILKKLQESNMDIIECGWLKDFEHEKGTTFYHVPSDVEQYLDGKNERSTYVVMIDWDRYDVDTLPVLYFHTENIKKALQSVERFSKKDIKYFIRQKIH